MKTQTINVLKCNSDTLDIELHKVAECIRNSGIVVFPTETVYGIGANALDANAVQKIFSTKGRASDNPLIVHISNISMLNNLVTEISYTEQKLIDKFWPGPLTIIFNKKNVIPDIVSSGLNTIGIRMPNNKIALQLIEYSKVPIAAPSANISGRPSGTAIEDIYDELYGNVDYIINTGNSDIGLESTVIRVVNNNIHILRPGQITKENLNELGYNVIIDNNILSKYNAHEVALSPGVKYRHYAPNSKCILVYSDDNQKMVSKIQNIIDKNKNSLVIASSENTSKYNSKHILDFGSQKYPSNIAKNIFRILRKVDSYGVDIVIIEGVSNKGIGLAIMNRLIRACEYNYIKI